MTRWTGLTRHKKNFFAFLHDSEHVLILIFESGKKCQKWRLLPKWENSHFFLNPYLMSPRQINAKSTSEPRREWGEHTSPQTWRTDQSDWNLYPGPRGCFLCNWISPTTCYMFPKWIIFIFFEIWFHSPYWYNQFISLITHTSYN